MILKTPDNRTADIAELKTLKAASPAAFHAVIQKQIDNICAGAAGERDAAHFLGREFGRSEDMAILHDLRLGVNGDHAQIDHLVIHRVQQAAWVLETKNYSGRLTCDEHGDWTLWKGGKPRPIPSPINQARRQCETLRHWLDLAGVATIRQIHPVVLIAPTSSIDRTKLPPDAHVVKSDNFGAWWKKQADQIGFAGALGMLGRHLLSGMSREDFVELGERLARAHVPPCNDWRARLRLPHPARETGRSGAGSSVSPAEPARASGLAMPSLVSTPHGVVTITRIPDGRYALRNDRNDALIELVRNACRGKARWNPRFRNWLAAESELVDILAALGGGRHSA